MFTIMAEVYSMVKKVKRKAKKKTYCKRCGVETKAHFHLPLNPKRTIEVCTECFDWAMDKTQSEIKKDYAERAKRKKNG